MKRLYVLTSAIMMTMTLVIAQSPTILVPLVYSSGGAGITAGQTAKWKLTNPAAPAPIVSPTCSATLSFTDDQARVLKTALVSVKAGESRSLDLSDSELPTAGRAEIHALAVVLVTAPTDQPVPIPQNVCAAVLTLEIVDNATGKTTVVMPGVPVRPTSSILRPL